MVDDGVSPSRCFSFLHVGQGDELFVLVVGELGVVRFDVQLDGSFPMRIFAYIAVKPFGDGDERADGTGSGGGHGGKREGSASCWWGV